MSMYPHLRHSIATSMSSGSPRKRPNSKKRSHSHQPERVGGATVIPLMNGVDHVALLRDRYPAVIAGAIRVESERLPPAQIRQRSPFLRVELGGAEPVAAELSRAGIDCRVREDEMLPTLGQARVSRTDRARHNGIQRSTRSRTRRRAATTAVAKKRSRSPQPREHRIDEAALFALQQAAPSEMRSSMQKDVAAGRAT